MINRIKNMSKRGKAELAVASVFFVLIMISSGITSVYKSAWEAERTASTHLQHQLASAKTNLHVYKEKSVTFEELEIKDRDKIESYVKKTFRAIPKSVAKLIAESTTELSKKYNLAVPVIVSMMKVESNFNPSAVSNKGARGLMQVRWSVWKKMLAEKLGMKDRYDLHNIYSGMEAGVIVLKHYLDKNNGDLSKALYDYVGKSRPYVKNVYETMGRFILYGEGK
jgi:soluble lytic murein transglycosylase-like protein